MAKKTTKKKLEVNCLRVNVYEVLSRAIESGLLFGYKRAHKHTETPSEDMMLEAQRQAIMTEVCEVFSFFDDEE